MQSAETLCTKHNNCGYKDYWKTEIDDLHKQRKDYYCQPRSKKDRALTILGNKKRRYKNLLDSSKRE
jgi:hypothetical protein